jgi:hypothetical protein
MEFAGYHHVADIEFLLGDKLPHVGVGLGAQPVCPPTGSLGIAVANCYCLKGFFHLGNDIGVAPTSTSTTDQRILET